MKPPKAVFAAVLKPADDIRLFQKIALSFYEYGFQIHSLGFGKKKNEANHKNICFHSLFSKSRLHWSRGLVGFRLLWHLFLIHPQMIVCGAVEILPFCVLYKILAFLFFRKVCLCYDIQENYAANILFTQGYLRPLRLILAKLIRLTERLCTCWIDTFFLAERCYAQELPFVKKQFLVLENKFLKKNLVVKPKEQVRKIHFLYAGTLANEYGLEKVLQINDFLKNQNENYQISIVGKCSTQKCLDKLRNLKEENIFIKASDTPIAYEYVLEQYQRADVVLMPYQINQSYQNRIPTKFYEAMAHNAWIWVQENPTWKTFFEEYGYKKVVFTDFWQEIINFESIIQNDFSQDFPFDNPNIFWEKEKEKIFIWLQSLDFLPKSSKKS